MGLCVRCEKRDGVARRLCNPCYLREYKAGNLHKYPTRNRQSWDFTEDYLFLKQTHGDNLEAIANRMGISVGALKYRLHLRRKWGQL